jgi:RNA polymerase sigma-70 factor (ECF subfamily)
LREKLFMASADGAPKLGEYAGRGSLAGWLKVVAVRLALTRLRSRRAPDTPTDDEATFELPSPLEPELDLLRAQYSGAFKVAFQSALQELDPRDRELLRLHFLENMTVDQIGASYRVHRATAARWVARARGALLEGTKGRLAARLDVPISQLDSIVDLVRSHVDVSLVRLLAADPARADSAD